MSGATATTGDDGDGCSRGAQPIPRLWQRCVRRVQRPITSVVDSTAVLLAVAPKVLVLILAVVTTPTNGLMVVVLQLPHFVGLVLGFQLGEDAVWGDAELPGHR